MLRVISVKRVSDDVCEIQTDSESAFFLRFSYLDFVSSEKIVEGAVFSEEESLDIFNAAFVFVAEKKARSYLARSEQYRTGLERKLLAKKFSADVIKKALDFLESKNLLCDKRFAFCWIRSRASQKPQGRHRLETELLQRGVQKSAVNDALDEFFSENDESAIFNRAFQKYVRACKIPEKIVKALVEQGFPYKMVRAKIAEEFNS